jgi:beta-galactosidase
MGTSKPENTVICLESPRIREAIAEYIRINTPKFHANPDLLYDILAYELMYMCYCERSQRAFRTWLAVEHGDVRHANAKWGTTYRDFNSVTPPPVRNTRPLPGVNRGLWYDWARFNQDRFTQHLLWVRGQVRRIDPSVPLAAGGSSSMLSGAAGTSGIDEERIVNEVDDIIIHEGGGSTLGMDLQLALANSRKPLADPEMNLSSVFDLLPHILHGKSVIQLWHWPAQPGNEFHGNNRNSLAHGWKYPLEDVGELMRVALDVRRLNNEIAAFAEAPAQVAILYSRTAALQVPPEMLSWSNTPYLDELRNTYEASRLLDTKVTFVTERQIASGALDRYKLLLVPAAANLPQAVVERIWAYASRGGRVLVVPDSLRADEYNRPAGYLDRIGIRIEATRAAHAGVGATEQSYYQTFEERVRFTAAEPVVLRGEPGSGVRPEVELRTRGVRQKASVGGNAQVLFRYPDGSPSLWRIPLGSGAVYYSATSLDPAGYGALLDVLFSEAAVERTGRVRPLGGAGVEARFARLGNRSLVYVSNAGRQAVKVKVEAQPFRALRELRDGSETIGDVVTAPARQTQVYEILK